MTAAKYYVGIDGGGSKTEVVIGDSIGNIYGRGLSGSSNPLLVQKHLALKSVTTAFDQAKAMIDGHITLSGICLCIPGFGKTFPKILLAKAFGVNENNLEVYSDHVNAYKGALLDRPGILVSAGTGSFVFGKDSHNGSLILGGWGPLIGDEGSGYAIGRMALSVATKSFEGRVAPTLLLLKIKEYFGNKDIIELKRFLISEKNYQQLISSIAPIVLDCAKMGDETAKTIITQAAGDLAELALQAIRQLDYSGNIIPVVLTGGISSFGQLIIEPFSDYLHQALGDQIEIVAPVFPPVIGALLLAMSHSEEIKDAKLVKALKSSYKKMFGG